MIEIKVNVTWVACTTRGLAASTFDKSILVVEKSEIFWGIFGGLT